MREILLDTCALIYVLGGEAMGAEAKQAVADNPISVSAVSALEIAILMRKGRFRTSGDAARWFRSSVDTLAATLHPMSPDILFASQALPGLPLKDPFDRIVIATAGHRGAVLVTRDRAILAYGAAGHVAVMGC